MRGSIAANAVYRVMNVSKRIRPTDKHASVFLESREIAILFTRSYSSESDNHYISPTRTRLVFAIIKNGAALSFLYEGTASHKCLLPRGALGDPLSKVHLLSCGRRDKGLAVSSRTSRSSIWRGLAEGSGNGRNNAISYGQRFKNPIFTEVNALPLDKEPGEDHALMESVVLSPIRARAPASPRFTFHVPDAGRP